MLKILNLNFEVVLLKTIKHALKRLFHGSDIILAYSVSTQCVSEKQHNLKTKTAFMILATLTCNHSNPNHLPCPNLLFATGIMVSAPAQITTVS